MTPSPPHPIRPATRRTTSRALARWSIAALVAVSALFGIVGVSSVPAAHADGAPYQDPNATGFIGLCNQAGESIDHGRLSDQPFVWAALGSERAPAPYDADGRTATLYAYQPRDGVSPGEWSGEMLTASARYSNPAHPMAQATAADSTLADFVDAYPPQWNGFVQLRIYLGAPDQPIFSATYAATDLQISGDTWTVVRGGSVPCNSGTAVSLEDLVTPTTPPTTGPVAPATSEVVASTTIATADPSATTTPLAASESAASTSASSGSSGPSTGLVIAVVVVVLVAIAVSLVWLRRRRSVRPT